MRDVLTTILDVLGVLALAAGFGAIYPPLALIVLGTALLVGSVVWARP